ncbi:unnamed protein product [Withania somnifera]
MYLNFSTIKQSLSKPIPLFGIKLQIAILTFIILFVLVFALLITPCIITMVSKDVHKNSHNSLFSSNQASGVTDFEPTRARNRHPPVAFDSRLSYYQFTLSDIETATDKFADGNVVSCGDYAIVYHGIMFGNTRVTVKRLLSSRHKNLVKLIGYCFEGYYGIIVDEYVDNGNLGQCIHGCVSEVSPLTWNIRMSIVLGIAKGLAYLHEDTEPAIIHQNLKSSSRLLDKYYLLPEYLSTGILDYKSDVYCFGVLVMEIVSGKPSIWYTIKEIEECLVDWMKSMVARQQYDQIVDPKLPEMLCMKELKIILLKQTANRGSVTEDQLLPSSLSHCSQANDDT